VGDLRGGRTRGTARFAGTDGCGSFEGQVATDPDGL